MYCKTLTIAHDIPVTFVGVELDRKAANVSDGVGASSTTEHGRESKENGGLARCVCQDARICDIRGALLEPECTECTGTTSMDDSLGNTLVVEPVDLS